MEIKLHYHVCGKMTETVKVGFHFDNSELQNRTLKVTTTQNFQQTDFTNE